MQYIGRFAPSPTGPLHFGSLVAAVASYCDAKAKQGQWLLRIENVDTTREVKGAAQGMIECLEAYGFEWDGDILFQNQRSAIYQDYLDKLIDLGLAYPCQCTRKAIADMNPDIGLEGYLYPGTCRHNKPAHGDSHAWRMPVGDQTVAFHDRTVGLMTHNMARDIGDFILKRADGIYSYHLAVAADDALQGVTHIVRGEDLLHSTSRQLLIQQALDLPTPRYKHIPVVKNDDGEKLSKQTLATAIDPSDAVTNLYQAFDFLHLNPAPALLKASLPEVWQWGIHHWPTDT